MAGVVIGRSRVGGEEVDRPISGGSLELRRVDNDERLAQRHRLNTVDHRKTARHQKRQDDDDGDG